MKATLLVCMAAVLLIVFLHNVAATGTEVSGYDLRMRIETVRALADVGVSWESPSKGPPESCTLTVYTVNLTESSARAIRELPGVKEIICQKALDDKACKQLSKFDNLEGIWIREGCTVSDAGIRLLCSIPGLKRLRLDGFTSDDMFFVEVLATLPLEVLSVRSENLSPEVFENLSANAQLRHLMLWGDPHPNRHFEAIGGFPQLERMDFLDCLIPDSHSQDANWKRLSEAPKLTELRFFACELSREGLDGLSHLKRLNRLEIYRCGIASDHTAAIASASSLLELSLRHTSLKGIDTTPMRASRLLDIDLSYTDVNESQLKDFVQHDKVKSIQLIDCRQITNRGLELIAAPQNLERLVASGTGLDEDSAQFFRKCRNLKEAFASDTKIGNAVVAQLARQENLESISLSSTLVDDDGVRLLKDCRKLQKILLQKCNLNGSCLAALVSLPDLKVLSVSSNRNLDDAALAPLRQSTNLNFLDLSDTQASPKSLRLLADLPMLQSLWGTNCRWPKKQIQELRKSHPYLKVADLQVKFTIELD